MNMENIYTVYHGEEGEIACGLTLENALLLARALLIEHYDEDNLRICIVKH